MPSDAAPHALPPAPLITAFDFDGTLTVHDSFTAFLRWRTTRWRWWVGLLKLAPALLVYLLARDRGRLKVASVNVFLKGLSCEQLADEATRFATDEAGHLLRPDALATWTAHRAAGRHLVIVTASPEEIVAPFAERLGADALIGTRLRWSDAGRLNGEIQGANCRGREKVRRLHALYGDGVRVEDAYGDTSGDLEMLAMARRPHMRAFTGRP